MGFWLGSMEPETYLLGDKRLLIGIAFVLDISFGTLDFLFPLLLPILPVLQTFLLEFGMRLLRHQIKGVGVWTVDAQRVGFREGEGDGECVWIRVKGIGNPVGDGIVLG